MPICAPAKNYYGDNFRASPRYLKVYNLEVSGGT